MTKSKLYSAYQIWCPEHGYRSAAWYVAPPKAAFWTKDAKERQWNEVTLPAHAECGFTILEEVYGVSFKDIGQFFKRETERVKEEIQNAN